MKISTRGRYALRVMVDLAEHSDGNYIPLKDIAERQKISKKYLESIMLDLSKVGLVDGRHGKGGGYKLNRQAESYTVIEILRVTEGDLAPVTCLDCGAAGCERVADCRTFELWAGFYELIKEYFGGKTLADLIK
ncbi:MAG: Rrf2 family transcriptional regulator [Clostridia bacterium]|nr:Rrf2 family transcriptional regulator [Clostridia bacterium]